ncbi:hypothetical protein F5B22DRAFT_63058 [Xylaria bambusicola]|uniref:uncharacterized protein n=1 Tax=Xylaria bambusicola TaxID=326684 RepID=UPI00200832F0|nr:uncharacterized protein F5B22DRAFT_63058 [Xylaria bambusicola]KAI0518443.1 hypothetical protein F5B22DRAFT_63058 [Xylaria bambusicola]
MASELRRPPTRTASGSRPPTSRFQEGSMNDRASAAPPVQFLGPDQLKDYEDQFYNEPPTPREARRTRPFSAAAVYQHASIDEPQEQEHSQHQQKQRHAISHKKSSSFFGRVRDALFHRGGGGHHGHSSKQQEVRRKHSSLQEPIQQPLPPPPPRPDYLHAGRTQSEVNIAQILPNPRGAADRPSREDVMASYNELVASGFFQSHAIKSTRHAPPSAAAGGRQTPVLSNDHQPAPRPPVRIPSLRKTSHHSDSISPVPVPRPSPIPQGRDSREYSAATMAPPVSQRPSLSSLLRPSIPDLHTKDSWYTLRGRKRTRGDGDETPTPDAQSSSTTNNSAGYFSQPLKRVAKKLREMPSSSSQLNSEAKSKSAASASQHSSHQSAADGVVRLVPSVSSGGSVYPDDRPIRLRSPSPGMADTVMGDYDEQRNGRTADNDKAGSGVRRPRKTFSYNLMESSRTRGRTADRERGRERDNYRVQRRSSSTTRTDSRAKTSRSNTPQPVNALGQWQGVSLEDPVIHRDSIDSTRSVGVEERTHAKTRRTMQSPLQTMTDANHRSGVPAVVAKAPERWHNTGKAYHLKDRGSRPDLAMRRSEDSGKAEGRNYGKENDADWQQRTATVDGDGDENRGRHSREAHYRQHELPQWHIGSAL